ncbi:unnamed protein product [Clonostachys chloroleuca]|uniref:Uncharacterized protein n=1 Tax=Clonostachys chloroleuca TaxID=1926264 RepID=A0AA35VMB9_9HYPO|nr:unnamed protein product [Clonostachys chloroleuca]
MSTGNIRGFTKKTTVNAMIFIGYCVGNIVGPHLFVDNEAPSYPSGFLAMMICFGIALVICTSLRFYLIWENRRRDRLGFVNSGKSFEKLEAALFDKTDKELLQFRYVYWVLSGQKQYRTLSTLYYIFLIRKGESGSCLHPDIQLVR